jgi:hypothetical protein
VRLICDGRFRLGINRTNAHIMHDPNDTFTINVMPFFDQLSSNASAAHERILEMNFVNHTTQLNLFT